MEQWRDFTKEQLRKDLPDFVPGDTVNVHYRVVEGDKERIQIFTGTVIKMRGEAMGQTFTVRKISGGIGVERIFMRNSPFIASIDISRRGRVRRAKLYYLRGRKGKSARLKEKTTAPTE